MGADAIEARGVVSAGRGSERQRDGRQVRSVTVPVMGSGS